MIKTVPKTFWYKLAISIRNVVNAFFLESIKGAENFPKPPFIVACNHVSIPDGWLIANIIISKTGQPPWFIARDDFWFNRWWTRYVSSQLTGLIIDWRNPSLVIEQAIDILKAGGIVGIFPEATRNAHEKILLKGKTGVARLCLRTGCPVVPMGYFGPPIATTWDAVNHFVLHRNLAKIIVGKPMGFEKAAKQDITKEMLYKTTDKIMIEIGKLSNKRPQLHYEYN